MPPSGATVARVAQAVGAPVQLVAPVDQVHPGVVHVACVASPLHDVSVPVQLPIDQLHPYCVPQAVWLVYEAHGGTVPVHGPVVQLQ
jgi:hypothetical protein